jgi:hypothetical protein
MSYGVLRLASKKARPGDLLLFLAIDRSVYSILARHGHVLICGNFQPDTVIVEYPRRNKMHFV